MSLSSNLSRNAWKTSVLAKVSPRSTALLIIDLQRDFCADDGALAALGSDVSPCRAVAGRVVNFLPRVREMLSLVAFFQLIYDPKKMSESQQERLLRNGKPIICAAGSPGSNLFIAPVPGDRIFAKHRYSAFSNRQFRSLLKEKAVTTVAVAGVDTQICVEGTVRHGYDLGYRMLVLTDLVATRQSEIARHDNSLALCDRYFALAIESDTFLEVLRGRSALACQTVASIP